MFAENLALFDVYQQRLAACDAVIQTHLATLTATAPPPATALPEPRRRQTGSDNEPHFDLRPPLHHLSGVDLTQIDGIGAYTAVRLISEIGLDMTRWPTEQHFSHTRFRPC